MSTINNTISHKSFSYRFYKVIMPKVYGFGAAVVIAGAMFKLLNWPGGSLMLGLGLSTEALIFILGAFEPEHKEVDWTRVYPELRDDYAEALPVTGLQNHQADRISVSEKLDEIFNKAKIDAILLENLHQGMRNLAASVSQMADITHAVKATEQYTKNLQKASIALEGMYTAQDSVLNVIQNFGDLTKQLGNFNNNMQSLSEVISHAHATYTADLQRVQHRLENTGNMYNDLARSMEKLEIASGEAESFKAELAKLNDKLNALNNIYGNMLMAFRS